MSWQDLFDEEITDFDATSPAWDGQAFMETGDMTEFDSYTSDADIAASTSAKLYGSYGMELVFDDAGALNADLDFGTAAQTSMVMSFSFNPKDVALASGEVVDIAQMVGVSKSVAPMIVRLHNNSGQYRLIIYTRNDAVSYDNPVVTNVEASTWYDLVLILTISTGVGANDGVCRLYKDGVYQGGSATLDNDTYDLDAGRWGMLYTNSVAFGGSYYFDNLMVDPVGAPFINEAAAKHGSLGLSIPFLPYPNNTARYCDLTGPTAETAVTYEFWYNADNVSMDVGDIWVIAGSDSLWSYISYYFNGGNYYIYSSYRDDAGGYLGSTYQLPSPSGWHLVRVVWAASTGVGQDDGYQLLYVDGVLGHSQTGIDNDTRDIDLLRFGAGWGLNNAGEDIKGIFLMDNVRWANTAIFPPNPVDGIIIA